VRIVPFLFFLAAPILSLSLSLPPPPLFFLDSTAAQACSEFPTTRKSYWALRYFSHNTRGQMALLLSRAKMKIPFFFSFELSYFIITSAPKFLPNAHKVSLK
jgi:hypothetical protein